MLFNEVYSAYYNTVTEIVKEAQKGGITEQTIMNIVKSKAFSESLLAILPAIKNEEWLVINKDFQTPIKNTPRMPLTTLQKRWLKALLSDPRVKLFGAGAEGLEDCQPLYNIDDFVFFDRYSDGDPYEDEGYIRNFKATIDALREKRRINIEYRNRHGTITKGVYAPIRLEYSAKDDKFRLEASKGGSKVFLNLVQFEGCELLDYYPESGLSIHAQKERELIFELTDKRNALDRAMLHFSDCRKETRRLDDGTYQVKLWYDAGDASEMVIRVLSFGHLIKVTAPKSFIELIKKRLAMQESLKA